MCGPPAVGMGQGNNTSLYSQCVTKFYESPRLVLILGNEFSNAKWTLYLKL
jgi:hypothetical protein